MSGNSAREWQFDGLVGPSHNYAGLSFGNVASSKNAGAISQPKLAALQGLEKMRFVRELGVPQAILPPQKRPIVALLQQLGFGSIKTREGLSYAIDLAYRTAPQLLAACYSASSMWSANAATVSPSADTQDGRLHLTPANLISNLHRSLEPEQAARTLRSIFRNEALFAVHNALPATARMADEGAANHMRVCDEHGKSGTELFVYGLDEQGGVRPVKFPARQHRDGCEAIARLHGLRQPNVIYVQQDPSVIDEGVFHNDVIAMNTTRLMVAHERAFLHKEKFIDELKRVAGGDFTYLEIPERELPVADAVKSYYFNSQLLELPGGEFVILAPGECESVPTAHASLQSLVEGNKVVSQVHYLNVRESMRNGGGPACLRLRVVLTKKEAEGMHQGVVLSEARYIGLCAWVERHYRDALAPDDLRDPNLIGELDEAYAALEALLGMPGLYPAAG